MKPKTKEEVIQIFEKVLKKYNPDVYNMRETGNGFREANELNLELIFHITGKRTSDSVREIHDQINSQYHPDFSTFGFRSGGDDWADREVYFSLGWNIGADKN